MKKYLCKLLWKISFGNVCLGHCNLNVYDEYNKECVVKKRKDDELKAKGLKK